MASHRPVIVVLLPESGAAPRGLSALEDRATVRYTGVPELSRHLAGADALLLWDFFSDAVEAAWPAADRLRWIHVAAAGVDRLLFPALRAAPVTVTNAHGIFDRPIAEFVLASLLADAKLLAQSRALQEAGVWRHRETRSFSGTRALVVGTGGIGREIARLLTAVGVQVSGAGRTARTDDPDFGAVVASDRLVECVGDFDYVVNAAPLTPQTRHLFCADVFAAMQPSAYFVNVGRGASVVEPDLVAALGRGELAGAALDVFTDEPLPPDSPLWRVPGLTISAHLSGDVVGWRDALADQFVGLADGWLAGEPLPHPVDKQRGYVPGH